MPSNRTACSMCNAKTKKGQPCKNVTCKWSPKCHAHRDVEIKKSTIPNSGNGVFATRDLKKNQIVGNYTVGTRKMSAEQLNKKFPENKQRTHIWSKSKTEFYDAKSTKSVAGIFNNCRPQDSRVIRCKNQAKITNFGNVRLTENVKKGKEIFTTYGREYWRKK